MESKYAKKLYLSTLSIKRCIYSSKEGVGMINNFVKKCKVRFPMCELKFEHKCKFKDNKWESKFKLKSNCKK